MVGLWIFFTFKNILACYSINKYWDEYEQIQNPFGFYHSRLLFKWVVGTLSGLLDLSIAFNNYYLYSVILDIELCITSEIKMALWELERFCRGIYVGSVWGDCFPLFLQCTYFWLATLCLLSTAGIQSWISSLLFWKHPLLTMQLRSQSSLLIQARI